MDIAVRRVIYHVGQYSTQTVGSPVHMSRRRRSARIPSEPVSLDIESLSHEGRGVARIDGKAAFVDGALPAERVWARYLEVRKRFDELRALEVEAAPLSG